MLKKENKVIIYAQEAFTSETAKTAIGFIKYSQCKTVAIVDRKLAGKKASDVDKSFGEIPIYSSIDDAKRKFPGSDVLLVGIAPPGGRFPEEWVPDMEIALKLKLNIVSGLHDFLSEMPVLKRLASESDVFIWDVRKATKKYEIASAKLLNYKDVTIVLTVGTDAAIGKMTTALELARAANKKGYKAKFIATGQTGMMISGDGIPIDAITGDFMAGAIEEEVLKAVKDGFKLIFVEGQGSILHPAWSSVTLALMHGCLPQRMILCHKAGRNYLKDTKVKINSLKEFASIYEYISLPLRKAKVIGISLNTYGLSENDACNMIKEVEDETKIATDDVVRNTGDKLILECLKSI